MSKNIDIYVSNSINAMYSERENEYMSTVMSEMFEESDEDDK